MGCPVKLLATPTAHPGKQVCSREEKGRWYEHAQFVLPTFIRYRNDYTYLCHTIGLESQQCYISCAALDIKGKSGMRKRLSPLRVRNQHTTYYLTEWQSDIHLHFAQYLINCSKRANHHLKITIPLEMPQWRLWTLTPRGAMMAVAEKLNSHLPMQVVKFISVCVCSPKVYNIFEDKD